MSTAKTHFAVKGKVSDPEAFRSLCGRSSGRVWRIDTIENHQNHDTAAEHVTCTFCLRIMERRGLKAA